MSRGKISGYSLTKDDVKMVLGMDARGDRNHDIAAWFGVNQGRIAEAKSGEYGTLEAADPSQLPPAGAPGVKGRRLHETVLKMIGHLVDGDHDKALNLLNNAITKFNSHEQ